jgi:hypothetical protein
MMSRLLFAVTVALAVVLSGSIAKAAAPDQTKPTLVKPDQAKPDQTKHVKPDQAKPDQVKVTKPDQMKTKLVKPDQVKTGKVVASVKHVTLKEKLKTKLAILKDKLSSWKLSHHSKLHNYA